MAVVISLQVSVMMMMMMMMMMMIDDDDVAVKMFPVRI